MSRLEKKSAEELRMQRALLMAIEYGASGGRRIRRHRSTQHSPAYFLATLILSVAVFFASLGLIYEFFL